MPYRILLPLLLLAAVPGCAAASPCDPNQRFEGAVCSAEPVTAADAGADAGGGADAATGCTQALDDALGVTCSAPSECGCAAPYCAMMPGQAVGYCTTPDCDPQGDDCPSGYQCFDLASLGVTGFPTFCSRQ